MLIFFLYPSENIFPRIHLPHFVYLQFSQFNILLTAFFCFFVFATKVHGQEAISKSDNDPYIDPEGAIDILQPTNRVESQRAYMFGISYGLNPIIILAPALSLSMYWDPLIIGVELSDSDPLGIWEKERLENFGPSRFRGETHFIKWFFGENFYILAAKEHRAIDLWDRSYNRLSGDALFDMHFETTVTSLGAGLLRFNEIGFLSLDIIRLNVLQKQSVSVVERWETWSLKTGNRERLDENIQDRTDKWFDIINSPSGLLVTFGVYF